MTAFGDAATAMTRGAHSTNARTFAAMLDTYVYATISFIVGVN